MPQSIPHPDVHTEEHELPRLEALLAGTLALMTGYAQAAQAELDPRQRLRIGRRVGENLCVLADHPQLSGGFRQVLLGLRTRWQTMSQCTEEAVHGFGDRTALPAGASRLRVEAPKRLQ